MNASARTLIRLANTDTYRPVDALALLDKVRECVVPLEGKAINLRVSHYAVEFDLFHDPQKTIEPFLNVLAPLGQVLTCRRLDLPLPVPSTEKGVEEARAYFNEERYWEVHEVLEGLWKKASGFEKELLQGIILACAALVHAQKEDGGVVWTMLKDAARRLGHQPAEYHGWPVAAFLKNIQESLAVQKLHFSKV